MRAVRMHQHGGPEVLVYEEAPEPMPGPTDVLVSVRAVALNHIDLWVRRGLPRLRLAFPHILGADVAGVVAAAGERVRGVKSGDEVILSPGVSCGQCAACIAGEDTLCDAYSILGEHIPGGYAERIAVPVVNVLPKPARLSFEEAAAVPLVFLTAWNMLVTHGRIRAGDAVLIWGAGSGVGSAAVQIARAFGARIIATAGAAWKLDRARALGADHVVNHAEQTVSDEVRAFTDRRGVDIVFDHLGKETWETSLKSLARGGRLVTCGATSGAEATTDIRYIYGRQLAIYGTWVGTKREMREVMRHVEAGRLHPVTHAVLPLAQAAEAHRMLERREQFGKIVLVP
ncbi:MAG: alcohol dehydrogenase [Armatimonadetes bacterium RBG_16_67_12]|nr:MAG: alcohol dehydrogenase [Armatimonadetes bacterium RBG_16_67_12]